MKFHREPGGEEVTGRFILPIFCKELKGGIEI